MPIVFLLYAGHTAVTDLNCVAVKDLVQRVVVRNSSSRIFKKDHPTFVATFLLKGRLYQIIESLSSGRS